MDIFDLKYYIINKTFLQISGLWPYQSFLIKCFSVIFIVIVYVSLLIPQINCYIKLWGEGIDGIMVRTLPLLTTVVYGMKTLGLIFGTNKIKNALNIIRNHWKLMSPEPEFDHYLQHAQMGRESTFYYMSYIFFTTFLFLSMPLLPCLLDQIAPLNETRERIFIYELDYGFENNKDYFYWIQLHILITAVTKILPGITFDTLFFIFTQHACGIFDALGNKLENIVTSICKEKNSIQEENIIFREIAKCVENHCIGLEYISSIESIFAISYLLQILVTVVILSFIGILVLMNLDKPHEAIRFIAFIIAHMFSIFYLSLASQRLIDETGLLFDKIYCSKWYELPLKCRKMLLQMMMKTKDPYKITAAQIYVIDIESFSTMIRASMSYFTMLSSMR